MYQHTALLITALALAPALVAQTPSATAEPGTEPRPRPKVCFQGARGEICTWFPLFEAGAFLPLTGGRGGVPLINYSAGFMVNNGPRGAIGVTSFAGLEDEIRGGVAVRVRRWLGPRTSLDIVAGVHLFGSVRETGIECFDDGFTTGCGTTSWSGLVDTGSPTLQARLGWHELVALSARIDVLRSRGFHNDCSSGMCVSQSVTRLTPRIYLGAELGSKAGLAVQGLSAVAAGVALIILAATWDGPFGG